jgi:STE24 endopeptidase
MRMLLRLGLALAAVTVAAVVIAQTTQPQPQRVEQQNDARFEVQVTGEMRQHTRIRNVLYFVGTAWSIGILLLLLTTGASRRMRDVAVRATKKPFVAAMLYLVLFILVTTLLELPLAYYSGFVVPHQFDLTNQSLASWTGDLLKGLGVSLLITVPLGAFALLGIQKVKNWWAMLWAVSIPLIILMVVIQPIVLDPIFNKFEPLQDQVLRQKLLDLASKAGIEGGRVYQVNKSKQTKTLNAYVNGIGPTNRIVMWDTLLAELTHDEVLAVMGHEMGHYVMKHIWKGLAFSLGLSFVVFFVVQRVHDKGLTKYGPRWGFTERGDPASVPWLLLIASVVSFLLSPVISGYSRTMEHQADIFGLEVTRLNEPMATAFIKLAENSKTDPTPHPFIRFWRYSHPPISERIPFSLSYKPWEQGKPNQLWSE